MRKILNLVLFVFIVFSFASVSADQVPKPVDKYVNDFGSVLNSSQQFELRGLFGFVEENTTAQVVFVSMDNINDSLSNYALQIGREWGVGQSDKNNGVVILYVKDQNRIYVAVGYGVEGILPDSKIGRLLDENYVSFRDQGQVNEGIVEFSYVLSEVLLDNAEEIRSGKVADSDSDNFVAFIIIFIVIITIIVILSSLNRNRRKGGFWVAPIFIPSSSGHSSGFSGGGFGGGGFGGGGAGR